MQRILKKSAYSALAIILAVSLMLPLSGISFQSAWADEMQSQAAMAGQADPSPSDQSDTLTIKAGAATPVAPGSNTYAFPHLQVFSNSPDRLIKSITVQFTSAITSADEVNFTQSGNFVLWDATKHGNKSVNNAQGATPSEWETYLRNNLTITLSDATTTKSLRMIASFDPVTRTFDYNSLNGHYYEVGKTASGAVDTSKSWDQALRAAEQHEYMGMKGYLVTITSREEQDFVFSLVHADTWMGGTCDDTYTMRSSAWAQNYRYGASDYPDRWADGATYHAGAYSQYYWVSGPEAGIKMGECMSNVNRRPATDPRTGEPMFMFWASPQPDGYSTGEKWMQLAVTLGTSAGDTHGEWNDLPIDYGAGTLKYVIEYGDMPGDVDDDSGSGSGDANVDVYVKVDINVDPTGKTITTEAEDITVGNPLRIQENANGGDVETIIGKKDEGKVEPATITRTFYQLKEGGNPKDPSSWIKLDSEPTHAGTYKVESNATYQTAYTKDDGTTQEAIPYTQGSATFKIKPKALDVTKPATSSDSSNPDSTPDATHEVEIKDVDPDDPTNPDGVTQVAAGRTYTKVYDGTTKGAAGALNISDLVVPGAQAYLSYASATYEKAATGSGMQLVLHGVQVKGLDSADYTIAGLTSTGDLTVAGSIVPRDLVISSAYMQNNKPIVSWIEGIALATTPDPSGLLGGLYANNAIAYIEGSATKTETVGDITWPVEWPESMLAPGDSLDAVLGDVTYAATTRGGLALQPANPQKGTYALAPSFAKVEQASDGTYYTQDGNYRVVYKNAELAVVDRPVNNLTQDENGNPDPLTITEKIKDPGTPPVTKDDIQKIVDDVYGSDPSNPSDPDDPNDPNKGSVPEGVDPIITIKKGGVVVDEIDSTQPGEYVITVVYPDPKGTDVEVDIEYVIEGNPSPADPNTQVFSISTKLKGAVEGASMSPSQTVGKGSTATVSWQPGPYSYVALVEIDGKVMSGINTFEFTNIGADHTVEVTLASLPVLEPSTSNGFYTVTVNRYGGAKGALVSPSMVLNQGDSGQVTWQPEPGYEIKKVMVDGVSIEIDPTQVGNYTFAQVNANHVVDVVYGPVGVEPTLSQDDLLVTTKIQGGPGSITSGSTVARGDDYHVAWEPVIQTTTNHRDPNYAVYEVVKVEVNGAEAAGKDERDIDLSNIKEDKEVVVTVKPVIYNVSIVKYGNGTVSPSQARYKGQEYVGIVGEPNSGSHISYISVDGQEVFKESNAGGVVNSASNNVNNANDDTIDMQSSEGVIDSASTSAQTVKYGATVVAGSTEHVATSATNQTTEGSESSNSFEANEPTEAIESTEAAESTEASDTPDTSEVEALALEALSTDANAAVSEPVFEEEHVDVNQANDQHLSMGIGGIANHHVVKVYFAEQGQTANPDNTGDRTITVIPGVEGGPGEVSGGGIVSITPDNPNPPQVTWTLPEGYDAKEVVINDVSYPVDPSTRTVNIADFEKDLQPGEDYTVTLVVEKRTPGDDVVPQTRVDVSGDEQNDTFMIETILKGGPGTISASMNIEKGKDHTVTWTAGEINGVKYRVAKVLIDGVEHPELLDAFEYTFADIDKEHTIEVVLEPIPATPADNSSATGTDSSQGDQQDSGDRSSTTKTGDMTGTVILGIAGAGLVAVGTLLIARRRMRTADATGAADALRKE